MDSAQPPARPHRVVGSRQGPELLAYARGEQVPRGDQVAGGIAHTCRPEVDHRAEPAVADQQVARHEVGVDPDRRAVPGGRAQGRLPGRRRRVQVEAGAEAPQLGDRGPRLGVVRRERAAAVGGRAARGIGAAQRGDERGEVLGQLLWRGDGPCDRVLALEPAVDRPGPGIPLAGLTTAEHARHGHRKPGCEPRQPAALHGHVVRAAGGAGEPYGHVVAQAEHRVHGAAGREPLDGQMGPSGELRGEQAAHERYADVRLVGVQLAQAEGRVRGLHARIVDRRAGGAKANSCRGAVRSGRLVVRAGGPGALGCQRPRWCPYLSAAWSRAPVNGPRPVRADRAGCPAPVASAARVGTRRTAGPSGARAARCLPA